MGFKIRIPGDENEGENYSGGEDSSAVVADFNVSDFSVDEAEYYDAEADDFVEDFGYVDDGDVTGVDGDNEGVDGIQFDELLADDGGVDDQSEVLVGGDGIAGVGDLDDHLDDQDGGVVLKWGSVGDSVVDAADGEVVGDDETVGGIDHFAEMVDELSAPLNSTGGGVSDFTNDHFTNDIAVSSTDASVKTTDVGESEGGANFSELLGGLLVDDESRAGGVSESDDVGSDVVNAALMVGKENDNSRFVVGVPDKPVLVEREVENREKVDERELGWARKKAGNVVDSVVDGVDAMEGVGRRLTYEVSIGDDGREVSSGKKVSENSGKLWDESLLSSAAESRGKNGGGLSGGVDGGTVRASDGSTKWVVRGGNKVSGERLTVFRTGQRVARDSGGEEKLREIFNPDQSGLSDEEKRKRQRLMNRAVLGGGNDPRSRERFTLKDREVLRFIGIFKYANARHLARLHNVREDSVLRRLNVLRKRGLVEKKELYGAKPLWFLTEAGVIASGVSVPRVGESGVNYSMLPHAFVVNHVAGNLWGGGVNVLKLEDFPSKNRVDEFGELRLGESLVSEFEIQSSFASAKGANHRAAVWRDAVLGAMNTEFKRWKNAGGVDFGPSPELVLGNEYMWTLFPPISLKLAYHVPDLVVKRGRNSDGSPGSIAVEIELANKPAASYERALSAYKYDRVIFDKVVWVVKSRGAASKLQEAADRLGMWDEGRVGIVPILTEDGVFKGKAEWTI